MRMFVEQPWLHGSVKYIYMYDQGFTPKLK